MEHDGPHIGDFGYCVCTCKKCWDPNNSDPKSKACICSECLCNRNDE